MCSQGKRRKFCGCCAAAENSYTLCWPIAKNNSCECEPERIEIHDYHVLMQQILSLYIRTIMRKKVRICTIRLSRIFKCLCANTVNPLELSELWEDTAITLCMLEKNSLAFLDVMTHLLVHLVKEVDIYESVYIRWMYPMERYLKTLKGYVRNLKPVRLNDML